jgi:hypothetical protein
MDAQQTTGKKYRFALGAVVLLAIIFGVPAILVPTVMNDVPERSQIKVITNFQEAASVIEQNFENHRNPHPGRRLAPLPDDTNAWIELLNPMGRKAPGGGLAILPAPDASTGAIGLQGDAASVTLSIPAYLSLEPDVIIIRAEP